MEKQAQEIGQFLYRRGRKREKRRGGGSNGRKKKTGRERLREKDTSYVTEVSP